MLVSRLSLHVLVAVWVAIAGLTSDPGRVRGARSSGSPGTLQLHNTLGVPVRVWVSVGPSTNCNADNPQGPNILGNGETWAVVSDQVICWRRDRVPTDPSAGPTNPSAAWTDWKHVQLSSNEVRDVTL